MKKRKPVQVGDKNALRLLSYIWLIYLPFNLSDYIPMTSISDWSWIALVAMFLVAYVFTTENPRAWKWSMPMELLIASTLMVCQMIPGMIIYPGWQISSILARLSRKWFFRFCYVYYAIILIAIIAGLLKNDVQYLGALIMGTLGPVISYYLTISISRHIRLTQSNQRLESIIRRGERERIARDLHDTLGQSLSMITVKAELASKLLARQPSKVPEELDDIAAASRQNLQLIRNIVNDLRQESLADILVCQERNLQEAGVSLITSNERSTHNWPTPIQIIIGFLLTESCTNVIHHAHAHNVMISFSCDVDGYKVMVQDDGNGEPPYQRDGSNGISGMRERLAAKNGTVAITRNSIGTLVTARIPRKAT